jgi:hypothetical protein
MGYIDLENLQQQYGNLLLEYKQSVSDYLGYLNTKAPGSRDFISMKGFAFNGTGVAGQSEANTLTTCEASCANTPGCSGATFKSSLCAIRSGDSPVVSASNDSYAIVPREKQLLMNMKDINEQLISLNDKITNKINSSQTVYYKNQDKIQENVVDLSNRYSQLRQENENLTKMIHEYETLTQENKNDEIKVTQNYYYFLSLTVIVIIMAFILFRISLQSPLLPSFQLDLSILGGRVYHILFVLILLIISINYFTRYW